jgi:nucleoside-diphosphate-sugar epimerase
MKVLLAGATGAIGTPLVAALLAGGHEVFGPSRTTGTADWLRALGAEPVIADAMDRDGLLAVVGGLRVDAVIHELTALKKVPMRHRDMATTDALRQQGTANLLAAARATGARRVVPYAYTFLTSTVRVSNAKAKRELGWTPSAPTYREGIERTAQALSGSAGRLHTELPSPEG